MTRGVVNLKISVTAIPNFEANAFRRDARSEHLCTAPVDCMGGVKKSKIVSLKIQLF